RAALRQPHRNPRAYGAHQPVRPWGLLHRNGGRRLCISGCGRSTAVVGWAIVPPRRREVHSYPRKVPKRACQKVVDPSGAVAVARPGHVAAWTTATGEVAWWRSPWLTEPSTGPLPRRPWAPTTSRFARRDSSIIPSTGWRSRT